MYSGIVDSVNVGLGHGRVVLTGRDKIAYFMDNRVAGTLTGNSALPKLTASGIIEYMLAAATPSGKPLFPNTHIVPTQGVIQPLMKQNGQLAVVKNRTQWDLIIYLCNLVQYFAFVREGTFYFVPQAPLLQRNTAHKRIIHYDEWQKDRYASFGGLDLSFTHNLRLAKDITVRAYGKIAGSLIDTYVESKKGRSYGRIPETYYYYATGTVSSIGELQNFADARALAIAQNEVGLDIPLLGDWTLLPGDVLQINNTNTQWDGEYHIYSVSRRLTPKEFTMQVQAKNHLPSIHVALTNDIGGAS